MDRFDTRLKAICEEFNHIEETAKEKVENKGRIIHIGKEVFYSDKSEEKKQAVFSGLINGGYISPTTSLIYSWEFLMKRYLPGLYYG